MCSSDLANWLRLRRAGISFDWPDRTFFVGQDKPLISPYQPDSLAEVGVPPLAGAGNLWFWLPQARYEERHRFGDTSGVMGQLALMQTESSYGPPTTYDGYVPRPGPAVEGRLDFWRKFGDDRRVEAAAGFHSGSTRIADSSVSSEIASIDWKIVPLSKLQFTGAAFRGQDVDSLGALSQGLTLLPNDQARAVRSWGGWAQTSLSITARLTWNVFSGIEDDRGTSLPQAALVRNLSYATNILYHAGPNVVIGLEALQMRSRMLSGGTNLHNRYDVAFGYLF